MVLVLNYIIFIIHLFYFSYIYVLDILYFYFNIIVYLFGGGCFHCRCWIYILSWIWRKLSWIQRILYNCVVLVIGI